MRYYGALAPHSPLRGKVVALAVDAAIKARRREKLEKAVEGAKKKARSWAVCLARVFEVFPLICPLCDEFCYVKSSSGSSTRVRSALVEVVALCDLFLATLF